MFEDAVLDPTCKGVVSVASMGGCWRAERAAGGVPASEASFPPEASQVVAEGDGLRVVEYYFTDQMHELLTDRHMNWSIEVLLELRKLE